MGYWLAYILIFVIGITLGGSAIVGVRRYLKNWARRELLENITLSFLAVFLTFMAAELFFKFFAQTDGWNYTLVSQNWFDRYWVENSMGYRDVEWSKEDLRTKEKILVIGDSFAAGYGIENINDRFSNILADKIGDDYLVMNIAETNFNTTEQIQRLKGFRYKPKILIYQYYINDIEEIAKKRNRRFTIPKVYPWPIFDPLVRNSYALNFIYWRLVRLGPINWEVDKLTWLTRTYDNSNVWWLHQRELQTIYKGAASEQVQLIVVVFPALTDIERSQVITNKVLNFFKQRGIPALDVGTLVANAPTERLLVNSLDAHPDEWVHQQVADELYQMILQLKTNQKSKR